MISAYEKFDLKGKTAVVTGGGTGIGYHMARALAQSGAKVIIAARREDVLAESSDKLTTEAFGNKVLYQTVDLSDRNSIAEFTKEALSTLGGVDIFIGNAGYDGLEHLESIKNSTIDLMFQVNVSANIEIIRAFLPDMRDRKWGRIILSSSVMSNLSTSDGAGVYSAVKGALNSFSRTAAIETGHDGITVNTLIIGTFMTEMLQHSADIQDQIYGKGAGQSFINSLGSMIAIGRLLKGEEMEGLIQLLASNAGSAITGSTISIDGGMQVMLRPNLVPN